MCPPAASMDGGGSFRQPLAEQFLWESASSPRSLGAWDAHAHSARDAFSCFDQGPTLLFLPSTFAALPAPVGVWGQRKRFAPLPFPLFASSFDFLLKTIVSRGVRRTVAFPFIPPLDVTLCQGHFLVSDALTPDTSRQMWSVVSEARLTAPPPLPLPYPDLMRRG